MSTTTTNRIVYFNRNRQHAFVALELGKSPLGVDKNPARELAVLMYAKSYNHGKLSASEFLENYETYRKHFERIAPKSNPRHLGRAAVPGTRDTRMVEVDWIPKTFGGVLMKAADYILNGKDCTIWWDTPEFCQIIMGSRNTPNDDVPVSVGSGKVDMF